MYDGNGDFHVNNTWSSDMITIYREKLDCLKSQYSNYSFNFNGDIIKVINIVELVSI